MWIVSSFSTMPPGSPMLGFECRRAMWTPCTMARASAGKTRSTLPCLPLSRPLMTTTLSSFLIFSFGIGSQDLGSERDDLHEAARPQFARHRTEDAGADRLALAADQHRGVAVEADCAPVVTPDFLGGADDDGAVHVALLDPAARDRLLDRDDDHVADPRGLALRAAEHLDALHPPRAGIVGDVEIGLHLDHAAPPASSVAGGASASAPAGAAVLRRRRG